MKDWGWLWHGLAGLSLGFAATYVGSLVSVVVLLLLLGYLREQAQHGWKLTLHQWGEAIAWGVGGILGGLLPLVSR